VWKTKSQTVRFWRKEGNRESPILPVRVRARTEASSLELPKGRYAASVTEQSVAAKGPGDDSPGGVTFRPGVGAKLPSRQKHGDRAQLVSPRQLLGYGRGTRKVIGGVAWTQRPSTLTGEVPRRPSGCRGVNQGHKSTTKRRGDATERRSPPGRLRPRDGSSPGVAAWRKGGPLGGGGSLTDHEGS